MLKVQRWVSLALVATTLLATAAISYLVHGQYRRDRELILGGVADRIHQRILDQMLVLNAVKGLIVAEKALISRAQLATFLQSLSGTASAGGVQGYGLAVAVEPGGAGAAFYPAFPPPWPAAGGQRLQTPIVLLEPQDKRNAAALGFDMFSEAIRREAMTRAQRSRAAAVSAPVELVQEIDADKQAGVLIYLPLFRAEGVGAPSGIGAGDLIGFVYMPIRIGDLVGSVLPSTDGAKPAVEIRADSARPDSITFASGVMGGARAVRTVAVADSQWLLRVGDGPTSPVFESPATFVFLLGCLISTLVALLGRAYLNEADTAQALAREIEARTEASDVLLGEMQHRIKNSIARKLALFRLSARDTTDRAGLIESYEARMQAMAKAQDILLNSPDKGASIHALLGDEIGAWQKANPNIRFDGPAARLDGNQLQALALIFHELTTNSLKYGALLHGRGLDVSWSIDAARMPAQLTLVWREQVPEASRGESAQGFGSRLIRLMGEGQLKGSVTRQITGGELVLTIAFPLLGGTMMHLS